MPFSEFAKDKLRAGEGVAEQLVDAATGSGHGLLAEAPAQDEEGERDLQADAPGNGAHADGAAVGGEEPCQQQHGKQAKDSGESRQKVSPEEMGSKSRSGSEYRG